MGTKDKTTITVETTVKAPIDKVWTYWTGAGHIVNWNFASDDWHCPKAENDLRAGGKLRATMAAKDGSFSFDFEGTYTLVRAPELLEYVLDDGRKVVVRFSARGDETKITERFEAEGTHAVEMQRSGWQAILDNFKKYTESH
ncbi:MAG: SRPBCC family protein [Bacteroidota bacterium]